MRPELHMTRVHLPAQACDLYFVSLHNDIESLFKYSDPQRTNQATLWLVYGLEFRVKVMAAYSKPQNIITVGKNNAILR